ncbi:MAG: histidinol dehydrogenase, partial [Kiritimatiellae bacterium]|nr:histidinol dehydrogenase [Kiritimatiellia bacterium]
MTKKQNGDILRIEHWTPEKPSRVIKDFLERPSIDADADRVARETLQDIRVRGESAVLECIGRYDQVTLTAMQLRVKEKEFATAAREVDAAFKRAVRVADKRIAAFSKAGKKKSWQMATPLGGRLGEQMTPYDRIGAYIPGGSAPLASTVLMTVTLARVAGVREIVACTPARPDGSVNPYL